MTTATLTRPTTSARSLLRTGSLAGLAAAGATTAVAAVGDAAGVSHDIAGEPIPLLGFAQLTFVGALLGVAIAVVLARRAAHARGTFLKVTAALLVLSFVPDVLADAAVDTRALLVLTHLVAAAIVVPALAARLSD
jgi:hypothetical protein